MQGGGAARTVAVIVLTLALAPLTFAPTSGSESHVPEPNAFVPFSPNTRVNTGNPTYTNQVEPTMVVNSQGRIFLGWKEAFTHNGGGQRVSVSYSTDGGATWAPNVFMALNRTIRQSDPWLTITNDRVFFTRLEFNGALTVSGISVSNTTDGVTWGSTSYYSDSPMFADKETAAHDAAGNLYWAWNTDVMNPPYTQDIVVTRSDDGGQTWTPEASVPDPGDGVLGAFVRVHPNGTVLLAWWSYFTEDIWFDRSFDGGLTWGADRRVNDIPGSAGGYSGTGWVIPLSAMEVAPGGEIYVVWPDYRTGNHDILFSRSLDGGMTWSPAIRLNDDATTAAQWMPDLALDPFGGIHAAWMDDRDGVHNVYYTNSTDGGVTWGPNVRVTTEGTSLAFDRPGDYLALETDAEGTVYIAWTDGRNGVDHDIYFAKLERSVAYTIETIPGGLAVEVDGQPFAAPVTLSWKPGTDHTVFAPSPQAAGPGTQYTFESWSDGGASFHSVTAGDAGATLRAVFRTEHEVSVRTEPVALELLVDGTPIVGGASMWWVEGTSHTLAPTSPQNVGQGTRYVFDRWSDGGPATRTVTVDAPADYTATFRLEYELTVSSARGTPAGGGWYTSGTVATFSVEEVVSGSPGTRYTFVEWMGDSSASTASAMILMVGPRAVTASWRTEHLLVVQSPYGTPTGAGWYTEGEVATASVPSEVTVGGTRYVFSAWTGDATATTASVDVTMDGPKTLTATWIIDDVQPPHPDGVYWGWLVWLVPLVVAFLVLAIFLWRRRRRDEDETPPGPPG